MGKSSASVISGGILAILGGLLILGSGFRTSSFLLTLLSYSSGKYATVLPYPVDFATRAALTVLGFIIALGGLSAILGGILALLKHRTIGKLFVALGGGIGLIGIGIAVGYAIYTSGPSILVTHIEYWIGVLIASVGRYLM